MVIYKTVNHRVPLTHIQVSSLTTHYALIGGKESLVVSEGNGLKHQVAISFEDIRVLHEMADKYANDPMA
jgi:hypothetical protein